MEEKSMTKRRLFLTLALSMVAVTAFGAGGAEGDMSSELRIGGATVGGAYYPMAQGIATLVTDYADGLSMVAVVTGGSVENPRLVDSKEVEMGLTNANLAYFAYNGKPPYEKKLNVAGVAALYPSVLNMFVLDNSSIQGFEDLKGKRIAVGPAGGGTLSYLRVLLAEHGMSLDDITPSYLSYADGFSQLTDGNVDAAMALAGYPASAVTQAQATHGLRPITISQKMMDQVVEKYPYYSQIKIPRSAYNLDREYTFMGVMNVLIIQADMPEDQVYAITSAVFDNLEEFAATNANAAQIDPKAAAQTPIPLHAGAKRYFDEQ